MSKKNNSEITSSTTQLQEDIHHFDLANHVEQRYLEYSMSVVKGRAIPFVQDGLKPVQRRILYAMKDLNLHHSAKPMKSARVVGDVLGKFHPHGDASVYDAMVRTSQDFALRYPLVIGQGNFGSRDGDGAAAMRYTEAKLSVFSDSFLTELGSDTVDWNLTYDNINKEPALLPARLPNILLNGASGIAVGIATEIPSHNLVEVVDAAIAMIRKPTMTLDETLTYIKGPDFATGAQIISSPAEIRKVYQDTKGSVRVRARYRIEGAGTKNWKIVFYEFPYGVSTAKVMEEVDQCFNPKPVEKKGKKITTPEQLRLKTLFSNSIESIRDLSDKSSPIRLTVEPRSHKQNPEELVAMLLAYTSMEVNIPVNLVMIGLDGAPGSKSLDVILKEWTEFRVQTVHRRTEHEHAVASRRLHILQGRMTILDHIEEVVQILKTADDAKAALISRFGLSEIQAEDVMEIKLRQLARLESQKILDEMKKLEDEIKRLQKLLDSPTAMKNQVIKELESDKKTFGDERRTLIEYSERTVPAAIEEQTAGDDPITVCISERGWIRAKQGHLTADSFTFKTGDSLKQLFLAKLSDQIVFLDDSGKSYSYPVKDLPLGKGSDDVPIATLADFSGAKLAHALIPKLTDKIILASDSGFGFIAKVTDLLSRLKAGKMIVNLNPGAKILPPICFSPDQINPEETTFSTLSSNGRLLCYRLSEISEMARGKGTALCGLDDGCSLQQIAIWPTHEIMYQIEGLKRINTLPPEEFVKHFQKRSSSKKGKPIEGSKNRQVTLITVVDKDLPSEPV